MVDGGWKVHDPEPQPNVLGALAHCSEEDLRRRGVAVLLQEVVLGQPHRREACLVGGLHLVEAILEQLVLVVVTPRPRQRKFVEQGNRNLLPPWKIESSCCLVSDVCAMCLAA